MDTTAIYLFDDITADTARTVAERLRASPSAPAVVKINSHGGAVAAAIAIYDLLRAHRPGVTIEILFAASAATIVACAGSCRASENALLMLHWPWVEAVGSAKALRETADTLERFGDRMISIYAAKTRKPPAEIRRLLERGDVWLDAREAQALGIVDTVTEPARFAARLGTLQLPSRFTRMPPENTQAQPVDVAAIQDAAGRAALAREQTRRGEIRALLVGVHAKNPALQEVLNACLDDSDCTPDMASQRLLRKLGESAEPRCGDFGRATPTGVGYSPEMPAFVMPSGPLAREFAAAERAARISSPVGYGGYGNREFIRAASDALAIRMGARPKAAHPGAEDFRETGLTGFAALCLNAAGQNTTGKSRASIVHAAMTTSDFPELLSASGNKSLVNRFEALTQEHRQICDLGDLVDFKPAKVINTSFLPGLERKLEAGEITYGAITEGAETYKLATYARGLMLTREMMVNDDLGAFDGLVRAAANSAARLERDLVFGVLTANAAMSDGVALFHATHGNLDTGSKAIDAAGLSAARVLMRKQKDSSGGYVMTAPRFIVCPVALESAAESLISALTFRPSSDTEIATPEWIRGLIPASDPRLDAADPAVWYLLSDPRTAPVIRLGYLNGDQNPTVEQDVDFDKDILKFKVRFDVACTAVGYAGSVKMA